jgi:hypothetical protein
MALAALPLAAPLANVAASRHQLPSHGQSTVAAPAMVALKMSRVVAE